ncbi:MAG: hypothetical protein LBJ82_00660 [Deltaproteobacteria bacterium]|jgi:hypothetical protein|nr:hypothetical protein [Deltaproteobacteria bacterium]
MRLCPSQSPADALESLEQVASFLCASLCVPREEALGDSSLCGAQLIFWALEDDLKDLRELLINNPS